MFLNKVDQMDAEDEEMLELVEVELRELLTSYEYDGRQHPDHPRLGAQGVELGRLGVGRLQADLRADGGVRQLDPGAGRVTWTSRS